MTEYGSTTFTVEGSGGTTNIVVMNQPTDEEQTEEMELQDITNYQHGLCDCTHNWGNCCLVCWCFPIAGCMVSQKLAENCCYPLFFGMIPLSVRFRSVAKIEEGMCVEGCKWMFCPCLSMCRMMNELDTRSFSMERE